MRYFVKTVHKNAEYYFRDLGECLSGYNLLERSIVIVEYDEDVYIEAKEFCLKNMDLLYDNTHEYNGYTFVENVELSKGKNEFKNGKSRYPKKFQMFAYNDNKQCLIFMAFNSSDKYLDKANELLPEWGDFLEEFYSEYYNFNV